MAGPYNRDATYAYAQAWWNGRAPGYPPQPNDCTNYVSQLLVAGGFTKKHVYGTTSGETFWPILGTNWYVAQEQRNWGWGRGYWSGLTPYKVNGSGGVSQIGTSGSRGDVVYYDYGSNGSVDHAAMVTGGNAGGSHYPAITQHSTDRINYLLLHQLQANPGMTAQVFSVQKTHS